MKYQQGDLVEIHSLGPAYTGLIFEGKIAGLSIDWGDSPATIWIVECPILGERVDYQFTHVTMPQACLRPKN